MKPKRKQQYVDESDKPLIGKPRSITPVPEKSLVLDLDNKGTLRAGSMAANGKTLWHTGHNFIRVTPAASQITYSLMSPTRIRVEIEIDPNVMAALEAANRSEEQKQLTNVRGVLNWLEHKSSHAPDLNVFRTANGRSASSEAKLDFISRALKAGLYKGWPTVCDRQANDEQFLEWANQQKDFLEAQEKWSRVQRLHDVKLEQETADWCANHESQPRVFKRVITSPRGVPEKVRENLKRVFGDQVSIEAIMEAREISMEAQKEAIVEVYGLIDAQP